MDSDLYLTLQRELQDLRTSILPLNPDKSYLDSFDEFVQEQEFGLALSTACDFLLEPKTPRANESVLKRIEDLQRLMKVEDSCFAELQRKYSSQGS